MFAWIADNVVTIVVIAVMLVVIAVAVISLVKDKSKGGVCTGNCATCGMKCSCKETKKK